MSSYTIYTYGGGEYLYYVFNAIATLFKGSFMGNMFIILFSLGIVWTGFLSAIKLNPLQQVKWLAIYVAITEMLLAPKVDVHIHDVLNGSLGKSKNISNVPFLLGVVSSHISSFGYALTQEMEKLFNLPDYMPYSKYGTIFASKILADTGKFRIVDPEFKQNLNKFVQNCVVYEALIGQRFTIKELQESNDIWSLISRDPHKILGFKYSGKIIQESDDKEGTTNQVTNQYVSCQEAVKIFQSLWNSQINKSIMRYAGGIYSGNNNIRNVSSGTENTEGTVNIGNASLENNALKTAIISDLPGAFKSIYNIQKDSISILKQELLINTINDAPKHKISELDGHINYAGTRALLNQRITYKTAGYMAGKMLVVMRAVFETVLYSSFIFVVAIGLLPGFIRVFSTYLGSLLWIQLWAPLYAVLNLIITIATRNQAESMAFDGITIVNSVGLMNLHEDMQALAGYLSISIPFISHAIIKGGAQSFTNLAGYMGGVMQSSAGMSAAEVASGNISLGNLSLGNSSMSNFSGFKHDASSSYSSGQISSLMEDGAMKITQPNGNTIFRAGTGMTHSQFGDSYRTNDMYSASIGANLAAEKSYMASRGREFSEMQASMYRDSVDLVSSLSNSERSGDSYTYSDGTSLGASLQNTVDLSKTLQKEMGISAKEAADYALKIAAGGNYSFIGSNSNGSKKLGLSANIGGDAGISEGAARDERFMTAKNIADRMMYNETMDSIARATKDSHYGNEHGNERRTSDSISGTYEKSESIRESINQSEQNVQHYSHLLGHLRSTSFSVDSDRNQEIFDHIKNKQTSSNIDAYRILTNDQHKGKREDFVNEYRSMNSPDLINSANAISESNVSGIYDRTNLNRQLTNYNDQISQSEQAVAIKQRSVDPTIIEKVNNTRAGVTGDVFKGGHYLKTQQEDLRHEVHDNIKESVKTKGFTQAFKEKKPEDVN